MPSLSPGEFAKALAEPAHPVAGYYVIREGSAFILTAAEIDLATELFRKPGSVALLIERRATGPAQGTFYFWKGGAFVHNLPFPFPIDPLALSAEERLRPAAAQKRPRRRAAWAAAAALAGAALFAGWLGHPRPAESTASPADPEAPPAVATETPAAGPSAPAKGAGDLEISWDPHAAPIATATAAMLKVDDGGVKRRMSLDFRDLQYGSVLYSPATDRVEVELLTLQPDGHMVETAVTARPASAPVVIAKTPEEGAPRTEPPPARTEAAKPSREIRVQVSAPPSPPIKRFTIASADRSAAVQPVIPDAPPSHFPASASAAPLIEPVFPSAAPAPAPKPAASAPTTTATPGLLTRSSEPSPMARAAAHSGRLIWTGTLPRRGVVELDGRSATLGSLNGALPGVPVNLTISPAEFSDDGLVVYTTDVARNNYVEPPNPGNGWNKIKFVWDPERVRQLAVLEAPNAGNHFTRLALRSDARRCSMILIDWSLR